MSTGGGDFVREIYSLIVKSGDRVIDVGAHSGRRTLPLASLVGDKGLVVAFEPLAGAADELARNLQRKGIRNVELRKVTLSGIAGEANVTGHLKTSGGNGLQSTKIIAEGQVVEKVKITKLDDEVPRGRRISFVRVSAEGSEYLILNGATFLLRGSRPCIAFENLDSNVKNPSNTSRDLYKLLESHRYAVMDLRGNLIAEQGFTSSLAKTRDYVAIPEERQDLIEFVRSRLRQIYDRIFEMFAGRPAFRVDLSLSASAEGIVLLVKNEGDWPLLPFSHPEAKTPGFDAAGFRIKSSSGEKKEMRRQFEACLYQGQTAIFQISKKDIFHSIKSDEVQITTNVVRDGQYWFEQFGYPSKAIALSR